jgi:hypothetical protein
MLETVLSQDDIDKIVPVISEILKPNPERSVAWIKERFGLTSEEYEMIFELAMPFIRDHTMQDYWASQYYRLLSKIEAENRKNPESTLKKRMQDLVTSERRKRKLPTDAA